MNRESKRASGASLSLEQVLGLIEAIPERMCGGKQPRFLYQLSRDARSGGSIVEIGTCAGKSTTALAYAQQQVAGVPVHTVDIRVHPDIEGNLERAGVAAFVDRIVGRSGEVAARWTEPIELLWIDGDHSYDGVVIDIESWAPHVVVGGKMAFHDYPGQGKKLGGVGRAVHELVMSRPDQWRMISDREAGSIVVFEKIEETVDPRASYRDVGRKPTLARRIYRGLARRIKR